MKIFSAMQIRDCDAYTIKREHIPSINLMERAAGACFVWLLQHIVPGSPVAIFCGNGNNGGDGLAIARILYENGYEVNVFLDSSIKKISSDAEINLKRAKSISGIRFYDFAKAEDFKFKKNTVIIDAVFGSGLNKKLVGKPKQLIEFLNTLPFRKIAIDLPTGLFPDTILQEDSTVFRADETLAFQFWKKVFLHPETGSYCGKVIVLDIGLSPRFIQDTPTANYVIDDETIRNIYRPRNDFSNKGNFGKTCIVGGSFGKIGAEVLALKAAMRAGSGITYALAPECGYAILQSSCPEAMFGSGGMKFIEKIESEKDFTVGIGPGLGTSAVTGAALLKFLKNQKNPVVLDADALNLLAKNPQNLKLIPENSIITPHPKEFERLFGNVESSFNRLELAIKKAAELHIVIVLKDHHTQVVTPDGTVFYNITGNSGMAKGGSGDALLGIITALLSQKYAPREAAIFGVWLHGKAGDIAAERYSKEAMLPTDLVECMGEVFKNLKQKENYL